MQLKNSQMEEMHRARCEGRDVELPCPLQVHNAPSISTFSPKQKLFNPII